MDVVEWLPPGDDLFRIGQLVQSHVTYLLPVFP